MQTASLAGQQQQSLMLGSMHRHKIVCKYAMLRMQAATSIQCSVQEHQPGLGRKVAPTAGAAQRAG